MLVSTGKDIQYHYSPGKTNSCCEEINNTPIKWVELKNLTKASVGRNVEPLEPSYLIGRSVRRAQFSETVWYFLIK